MFKKVITKEFKFEVVVVGAGFAGICAALAAARDGRKTALLTDRPVLGGNGSSEIRVPPRGAATPDRNLWAKETGIIEEITLKIFEITGDKKYRWSHIDQVLFDIVLSESNLTLFLNTSINAVKMKHSAEIISISGIELRAERYLSFVADCFIDSTGDGTLGALAGAEWRYGREARDEFKELLAPLVADKGVMGPTLLFKTKHRGYPVEFKAPSWAINVSEIQNTIDSELTVGRDYYRRNDTECDDIFYGLWWAEVCRPELDQIDDSGDISLEGRKLVLGLWDYIKNSGKFENVADQELDWIAALPGKRESRRLIGPHILTMNDLMMQTKFDDKIGFAGWAIDVHPPMGYLDNAPSTTSFSRENELPGITDIPLRSLYSKNINNLFFAGRNISCSHFALGSLRVQGTSSVMGQATGIAASICANSGIFPKDLSVQMILDIQNKLIRNDQSILNLPLKEDSNLTLRANITASSTREMKIEKGSIWIAMNKIRGIVIPVESKKLDAFSIYAKGTGRLEIEIFATKKPTNYRLDKRLKKLLINIESEGWVDLEINIEPGSGKKLFFVFNIASNIQLLAQKEKMVAVAALTFKDGDILDKNSVFNDEEYIFCFKTQPIQNVFSPEVLKDGYIRPEGLPHMYSSAKHESATLSFEWAEPVNISFVEIVFDSNLNSERFKNYYKYDELVRNFTISAFDVNEEILGSLLVKDNTQRFRKLKIEFARVKKIVIILNNTWGHKHINIFDFRVY